MAGWNAAVHHWVGGSADQQSGNDVQHGVLLQKDRRNADQDGHNGNGAFSQDGGEFPSVAGGKPDGERADNVDGRADIGVGVVGVNGRDQPNQRVAAEKERRPQILASGEKEENQQSGGIGENDKAHQTAESRGIPEELLIEDPERCVRIPMWGETRSLNLSNSVAIILYEALRQNGFEKMNTEGHLHHLQWK